MAKPLTPDARGWFGYLLGTERLRRGWEVSEMLSHLDAAGVPLAPSVYYAYEGGSRRPSADTLTRIEGALGVKLQEQPPTRPSDGDLVAALNRQSQAIEDLVAELRASREAAPAAADRPSPEFLSAIVASVVQGLALAQAENAGATQRQ